MAPAWLKNSIFYEIYPQSFYDTNGDGIGDIAGIISKLDYIKSLGCNALWLNPVYDSPFRDAGYDVRDYTKIAPRYGTNADMYLLFDEAHRRGIRVLLDLVPGHTSEEHAWFRESGKAEKNAWSGRYIWSDSWFCGMEGHPYIGGECERNGTYMLNFFKCQPALNYGFRNPKTPWQMPIDAPDCMATREAIKDVIRFWLSRGCDGFRVDMADSLVKDDDAQKSGTCEVWQDIFGAIRAEFPESAFVAEWSNPSQAIAGAGFDMDFYLDHAGNGYNTLVRDHETPGGDHSYFKADCGGNINRFLADYLPKYECSAGRGYISFFTCNHDTPRLADRLTDRERRLAYAFLFTMPGVPFLYYGDEIGMRYLPDTHTKEGGYTRTGSRTPMQWDDTETAGFSAAEASLLYLPVDPEHLTRNAASQDCSEDSMLCFMRSLLALRHSETDLQADAAFTVLQHDAGKPFVYRRGALILAVNPDSRSKTIIIPEAADCGVIYRIGDADLSGNALAMGGQSFAVLKAI